MWCWVARALNQLNRGDTAAAADSAARIAAIVSDLQGNRFWSEIVNWWLDDHNAQPTPSTTRWLDGKTPRKNAGWLSCSPPAEARTKAPAWPHLIMRSSSPDSGK